MCFVACGFIVLYDILNTNSSLNSPMDSGCEITQNKSKLKLMILLIIAVLVVFECVFTHTSRQSVFTRRTFSGVHSLWALRNLSVVTVRWDWHSRRGVPTAYFGTSGNTEEGSVSSLLNATSPYGWWGGQNCKATRSRQEWLDGRIVETKSA